MINLNVFGSENKLRNSFSLGVFFVREKKVIFAIGVTTIFGLAGLI